jgi:tetratricopeptide (TPR) repeat protein
MSGTTHYHANELAMEAERLVELGDAAGASSLAHKAMSLCPGGARARRVYGRAMIEMGRLDRALSVARGLRRESLIADAESLYLLLSEHEAADVSLLTEAAGLLLETGAEAGAERCLVAALEQDATYRSAASLLARLMTGAGRFEEALRWWKKMWRVDPRDTEAMAGVLVCAACLGRGRLADRVGEQLAMVAPLDRRQALMGRMWRVGLKGRLRRQATGVDGVDTARDTLSVMLAEAADGFESQLAQQPDYADLRYHLAVCREGAGHEAEAAALLDQALSINPGYVDALRLRVTGLLNKKNIVGARALLTAAHQRGNLANGVLDLTLTVMVVDGSPEQALRYMEGQLPGAAGWVSMGHRVLDLLNQTRYPEEAEVWRGTCYQRLGIELDLGEDETGRSLAA